VQVPIFFKRQVFLKAAPGSYFVPSGTVTSEINCAWSQVAADALEGNASAGTSENISAINNIVEVIFNLDVILISSFSIQFKKTCKTIQKFRPEEV
jgi:hypothetical protein